MSTSKTPTGKKPVPETVLKYRKRVEAWSAEKAAKEKETTKRIEDKKKIVFKRAEEYVKEYRQQASALGYPVSQLFIPCVCRRRT